jgi:D-alanyl-lipoteichoic acid acyltransferase DltB (MBOAT superfamily)
MHLLVTMLLGGLWHGASIRFIIWGGIHGAGLAIHKLWWELWGKTGISRSRYYPVRLMRFFSLLLTFHFVTFSWIFFRAGDFETARHMFEQIFVYFSFQSVPDMIWAYRGLYALMTIGFVIHWLPDRFKEFYRGSFIRLHILLKVLVIVFVILLLYQFQTAGIQPFIYFQF